MKQDFGALCHQIRKARNINQEELAACLGVTQATVSRWQAGVTTPKKAYRRKLAQLANISVPLPVIVSGEPSKWQRIAMRLIGVRFIVPNEEKDHADNLSDTRRSSRPTNPS